MGLWPARSYTLWKAPLVKALPKIVDIAQVWVTQGALQKSSFILTAGPKTILKTRRSRSQFARFRISEVAARGMTVMQKVRGLGSVVLYHVPACDGHQVTPDAILRLLRLRFDRGRCPRRCGSGGGV